jgi:hypothetical protein
MPCIPIQMPGGATAIVCTGRRGRRRCSACKNAWASLECDFPTPSRKSGTCDKPLCTDCAIKMGEDLDYCPHHPRETPPEPAQGALQL